MVVQHSLGIEHAMIVCSLVRMFPLCPFIPPPLLLPLSSGDCHLPSNSHQVPLHLQSQGPLKHLPGIEPSQELHS